MSVRPKHRYRRHGGCSCTGPFASVDHTLYRLKDSCREQAPSHRDCGAHRLARGGRCGSQLVQAGRTLSPASWLPQWLQCALICRSQLAGEGRCGSHLVQAESQLSRASSLSQRLRCSPACWRGAVWITPRTGRKTAVASKLPPTEFAVLIGLWEAACWRWGQP